MIFYTKLIVVFILNTLLANAAFSTPFPRGCEVKDFGYNENDLVLNEHGEQAFFLVQNHSNKAIDLEHRETKDVFMSPKLHTKIDPLHWAAFASDIDNLHFKCFTQDAEITTTVNCRDILEVCKYPRVKFALSNMGNYWVSTNKEQAQVIKDAAAKGILLRW